jgi:hypothetical protein
MSTPLYLPPSIAPGPAYGSSEWTEARRGRVTASRFGDVMTEPRSKAEQMAGKMGATAKGYLMELVAATITGQDKVGGKSAAMDRGVEKESDGLDRYTKQKFYDEVLKGRILLKMGTLISATPDGFIEEGEDDEGPGLVEVKCPESKTHLETFITRELPADYVEQVHGQMWVAGRSWCDFVSFDDRFPLAMQLVVIRVQRDEELIERMAEKVHGFADQVQARVDQLRQFLRECSPVEARVVHEALQDPTEPLTSQPEA